MGEKVKTTLSESEVKWKRN